MTNNTNISSLEENNNAQMTISERFRGFLPVIVDVETAGFNPKTDALLEIAASTTKFDDNGNLIIDQSFHYHIVPFEGANLEESNLKFLGIDPFNPLRQAVTERVAITQLFKDISKAIKSHHCKRAVLVGHNAHFDHGFVMAVADRLHLTKKNPFHPFSVIDTASLANVFLGQSVLAVACETAGLDFDNSQAHGALYDVQKETELFCFMVNRLKSLGGWPLSPEMNDRAITANQRTKDARESKKTEDESSTDAE